MIDLTSPQLRAECLAAVTGIFPTSAPTSAQLHLADPAKFVKKLADRVKAFLGSDKAEKFKWAKPPEQTELYKKITDPIDTDELGEWLADVPPEVAGAYGLTIKAARDMVRTAWPVYPDPSLGLHNFDLAQDEYLDVWQLMRTLDTVESIFDDLDARVLLPEQIAAFASIYPDLCQAVKEATYELLQPYMEIAGIIEKKKDLLPLKEELVRILMQLPGDVPIEEPQAQQDGQPAPGKSGRRPPEPKEDHSIGANMQTPSEHVAQRRVST